MPGDIHVEYGRSVVSRAGAGWLVAALCWAGACSPQIVRFEVGPRHICAGQQVEMVWQVKGQAHLTVTPRLAGAPDGAVAASGHATVKPTSDTRVFLQATRWLGTPTGRA